MEILAWADQKRKNSLRSLFGMLENPGQELQQMGSVVGQGLTDQARQGLGAANAMGSVMPEVRQQGLDEMLQAIGTGPLQTVWHGSPHKFDKFDSSKIGTGEGAQAYGHGLYLAENPRVAQEYATVLSADRQQSLSRAAAGMKREVNDLQMVQDILSGKSPWPNNTKGVPVSREFLEKSAADRADSIKTLESLQTKLKDLNNVYKVDLPDEHIAKMLDWDKPLSQQTKDVQESLRSAVKPGWVTGGMGERQWLDPFKSDVTGGKLLDQMRQLERGMPEEKLKAAGIPGIKYFDAGSRAGGEGTRNFVVFDDSILKILGKE